MDVKWVRDGDGDGAAVERGEKRSHRRRRSGGVEKGNPEVWQSRWELGRTRSLTRKQRGEMAEAAFLAKAAALGFRVAKPWGESSRHDLVLDNGKRLIRVQVKSAHRAGEHGGYTFHAHGNSARVYRASEIDLLVAYVVPEQAWYLFPVEEFRKYKSMKLFPGSRRRRSKFERFREAWGIVR